MVRTVRPTTLLVALLAVFAGPAARADQPATPEPAAPEDPRIVEAREEFLRGAKLVKESQWAEALAAFEHSSSLRAHPVTTYNIGACQRALGQYTKARRTLRRALAENVAQGNVLSAGVVAEINELVEEVDGLVARVAVRLKPQTAAIAVDGRPLEAEPESAPGKPVLDAGVRPPGKGEAAPGAAFEVVLDAGAHVITFSRKGFADVSVNRPLLPGSVTELPIELNLLPAVMHITSNQAGAVVSVNDLDVGVAPVNIERPGGSYHVVVRKKGFVTYDTRVVVQAGEENNLRAALAREQPALYERWWVWAGGGAVVTGAILGTYFATRPDPTRPAPDGGGLGWAKKLESARW